MSDGSEMEVKLAVADSRLFDLIVAHPEICAMKMGTGSVTQSFEALYYDTPGFALQQNGIAYRVRHEGEQWIATVKSDIESGGGFSNREEWNEPVEGPEPSLKPFIGTYIGDRLLMAVGQERFQLLFSTRFMRTVTMLLTPNGSQIEMAMDRGTIWSGMEGTPISELELELKSGTITDLLQLAGWIAGQWHLLPEAKSKFARGLELLRSNSPGIPSFFPDNQQKEIPKPTTIALSNYSISSIFASQKRLLTEQAASESVRELRIQIRSLRSLLKFLQPTLAKEERQLHYEKMRQWGTLLGSIRDIDILVAAWNKFSVHFNPVFSSSEYWLDTLKGRRSFLMEEVVHRIEQGELTKQIFELQSWLYQENEQLANEEEEQPSESQLLKMLLEAIKELREDIRAVECTSEIKTIHRLRIRIKQLRYVQETLNRVVRLRDEEFTGALKKTQSYLGKVHDNYQIKWLLEKFDASNIDQKLSLEKELFISWCNRDTTEYLINLPKVTESFRRAAKLRLCTLTALRTNRRTKSGHHPSAHEPGK